jgi:rhodanese-related sulfurtransferase
MNKYKILFLVFMMGFFTNVKSQVESGAYNLMLKGLLSHSVPEISVKGIDSLKYAVFIDSRSLAEFEVSRIKNARWSGFDEFTTDNLKDVSKESTLVVYCSVGYRSEKISEKLLDLGYANVYNLYGGIFEWLNEGKPVVDSNGNTTDTVHAYSKTWGIWLKNGNKVYK